MRNIAKQMFKVNPEPLRSSIRSAEFDFVLGTYPVSTLLFPDRHQGATVGMFSPPEGEPDIQSSRDHDVVGGASDYWPPAAARRGLLSR